MATTQRKVQTKAKPKVGGFRPNAGRKAEDNATGLKQRSVNLTDAQNEFLKELGGSVWLRGELNKRAARKGVALS